ncbi:IPT/TIG domain-containing protein [Streptomyces sp. ODS28]|uniref:IPT/TIG domain-containing protein n=1 Tax=Streptomyces sp. ODS28 TaxID=3136688 RepID=UPI0031EDFECD
MADYSRPPLDELVANQQKGYVGLHVEQGVPVLDRDLNLLHDLIAATVRSVVSRYIGNGAAAGSNGFAIQALPSDGGQNKQDFRIAAGDNNTPGSALVGGIEVSIPAPATYKTQPGPAPPPLTTPTAAQPDPRVDTVYLDVWLSEVDGVIDQGLLNKTDVGVETSVRLLPTWAVRVAEAATAPPAPGPGHSFYPLASLARRRGQDTVEASMITDLRQRRLTVADAERRLGVLEKALLMPAFNPVTNQQFSPRAGKIGQQITLSGSNFQFAPVTVRFGDIQARIVGAPSATAIVARVPGGLTPSGTVSSPVKITVSNAGGSVVSDDSFGPQLDPAFAPDPGTQFAPVNGPAGTQVTLNGFNFNGGSPQVQFGATAATVIGTPSNTQLLAQVPAGLVPGGQPNADVKITVTTAQGTVLSDDTFRAELATPAPTFAAPGSQFNPKNGSAGAAVTLSGSNFNFGPVTVKFDTVSASIVGAPSGTQINTQVPAGVTPPGVQKAVKITVTTAGGSVTSTDSFNVS